MGDFNRLTVYFTTKETTGFLAHVFQTYNDEV